MHKGVGIDDKEKEMIRKQIEEEANRDVRRYKELLGLREKEIEQVQV